MIRETSIKAYKEIKPKLGNMQMMVYEVIKEKPSCLFEIAAILGLPMHNISGRITELNRMGFIKETNQRRKSPTSRKSAIVWRVCGRKRIEQDAERLRGNNKRSLGITK